MLSHGFGTMISQRLVTKRQPNQNALEISRETKRSPTRCARRLMKTFLKDFLSLTVNHSRDAVGQSRNELSENILCSARYRAFARAAARDAAAPLVGASAGWPLHACVFEPHNQILNHYLPLCGLGRDKEPSGLVVGRGAPLGTLFRPWEGLPGVSSVAEDRRASPRPPGDAPRRPGRPGRRYAPAE